MTHEQFYALVLRFLKEKRLFKRFLEQLKEPLSDYVTRRYKSDTQIELIRGAFIWDEDVSFWAYMHTSWTSFYDSKTKEQ